MGWSKGNGRNSIWALMRNLKDPVYMAELHAKRDRGILIGRVIFLVIMVLMIYIALKDQFHF